MKIRVEKTPFRATPGRLQTDELIALLKQLRPGMSFVADIDNAHRATITAIRLWTGRDIVTMKEKSGSVRVAEVDQRSKK